jgi:hypothetical protein
MIARFEEALVDDDDVRLRAAQRRRDVAALAGLADELHSVDPPEQDGQGLSAGTFEIGEQDPHRRSISRPTDRASGEGAIGTAGNY